MGYLTMSSKEARRPGLVQAALAGKITNADAAQALRLSVRQFRRLKAAYRRAGIDGLLHGNRGRRPHNRRSEADRERMMSLIEGTLAGLNDCHLTEKLQELEGIDVSRESVRRLRRDAGIAPTRRHRAPKHRQRRLREASEGTLVLIDASDHRWFGPDLPQASLLGAVDDATGRILTLHFRPEEDLHGYAELLRRLATGHGLPCNLYGDRLSVFVRNDKYWTLEEELAGQQSPTQFGQMLVDLAVGYIAAHSPQAKGRIERLWETLQDRLVQELRLRGITSSAGAEDYFPEFIADHNRRFARPPRDAGSAWRRPPRDLERVLACRYARVVARDNTVSLPGRWIQIPPRSRGTSWQACRVDVRERLDGRLQVFHHDRLIAEQAWSQSGFTLTPRGSSKPRIRARLKIDLPGSRHNADRTSPRVKPQPRQITSTPRHEPKPTPWRKGLHLSPRRPVLDRSGRT